MYRDDLYNIWVIRFSGQRIKIIYTLISGLPLRPYGTDANRKQGATELQNEDYGNSKNTNLNEDMTIEVVIAM